MKTRYIAVLAAAAAILSFSGCGDTSEEGFVNKNEPAVTSAQTTAAQEAAPAVQTEAAAPAAESTADPAAADSKVPADPVIDGTESTAESTPELTGDYVFNTPNGDFTFDGLHADGLANTANGKWFALIPSDGGAGHMYYQTYYSTDGSAWNQGNMYDETNGNNYHYALPDGRIILFNTEGPIASNVPIVSSIAIGDDNNVKGTPVDNFFNDQYLDDGSQLTATEGLNFYVTYNGGYNFTFSFTDQNGIIVYNVNTDLDEGTLLMK